MVASMQLLVRDLIHFEEVEEVIKIRQEERAREYVEKYVISDSLRRNLLYMLEMLSRATHKSFNIVGNYGTGKSHFLAFVAALLEHPEYRALVRDDQVRAAAEAIQRLFLVVKFELGAAQEVSLRHIFFDQIRQQLRDRYDIEVREIHLEADYDNKKNVLNILGELKAQDPEACLVVVVDEISDFLKQKDKQGMSYDIALLRELGEVSQDCDFLYIGAMQEHVFTNPKYVDQAESIARVNQRFVTVTITKEDVAQVLTERVVRKDADQRIRLRDALDAHRQYFPNVATQLDQYVDLFPVHPYVIDVFERLPYFENRGIIGFTVANVKPILDQPAPVFITYDRVFDLINATHEVRNQPDVARVVQVVQTLQTKADLLDARYRGDAQKLIKALAVLNLLGGERPLGATSQELANTLLITPPSRLLVEPNMARDHIERVMKNIRDVTVGQYIDYADNRYSLNLEKIEDYDARIEQKARSAVIGQDEEIDRAFRDFVIDELGLQGQAPLLAGQGVYADTAPWPSQRSFRPGLLVIGRAGTGASYVQGDFRFVLQGPVAGQPLNRQDELILAVEFTDEMIALLVRARAAGLLAQERVHTKVMTKLAKDALDLFRDKYLERLLAHGDTLHGGHKLSVSEIPARRPLNTLADLLDHVKGALLDEPFKEKYPSYPVLRTQITAANLQSEMTRALQSLDRVATQGLDLNSRGYMESFGAIADGQFSASKSPACRLILERIGANDAAGKVTPVDDLVREFRQSPRGLPEPMVQLLLGALLFNGYLVFVRHGGARLHAGDVGPLLKNGLAFFDDIRYLERDKDIDVEAVAGIFQVLGLQPGLVRDKDSRTEAVKTLRLRGIEVKGQLAVLRQAMQAMLAEAGAHQAIPWPAILELSGRLEWLNQPVAIFADVSRVGDLGELDVTPEFREQLQARLADMETLAGFVKDWQEGLQTGLRRMQDALAVLPALESMAKPQEVTAIQELARIGVESRAIFTDPAQLLRGDLRRPLRGKLEQFRGKYDQVYYGLHSRLAGDKAPWEALAALRQSIRYRALGQLKGLPFIAPAEFNLTALEIGRLESRHCREFSAQVLEGFVTCPYCRFPEDAGMLAGLPGRIQAIEANLEALWQKWQAQVLGELSALQERLPLLSSAHRAMIEGVASAGKLPDSISADLLAALYELASELQPVELAMADLTQYLLARGGALTFEDLRAGIDAYLADILKGYDRNLVRIKLTVLEETQES